MADIRGQPTPEMTTKKLIFTKPFPFILEQIREEMAIEYLIFTEVIFKEGAKA